MLEISYDAVSPGLLAAFPEGMRHEQVVVARDPSCGYQAVVALHSTVLGPAVGGTRLWRYPAFADAVSDALRLSYGMTLKCAVAGLPMGGGKSVILSDAPGFRRREALRAHGRVVQALGGRYLTAEDVGTTPADMAEIRRETPYVGGLESGAGDPSPYTALGVLRAMQAAAERLWGTDGLAGRTVALQGCGSVGAHLARLLRRAGAEVVVADLDAERARGVAEEVGARVVPAEEILSVEADVLAPCALGGVLSAETIPALRVRVVAGAANDQLGRPEDAAALLERGILYVPDFVANAGGVISGSRDLCGWTEARADAAIDGIGETTRTLLAAADAEGASPYGVALRMAKERLARGG